MMSHAAFSRDWWPQSLDGVLLGVPPDYAPLRPFSGSSPVPEGSVIVLGLESIQPMLSRLSGAFVKLQSAFPACSLLIAIPPSMFPARELFSSLPRWRGVPVLPLNADQLSPTDLRTALSDPTELIENMAEWFTVLRPHSRRVRTALLPLFRSPPRFTVAQSLMGSGYSPRTLARRLRVAGLPQPGQLRALVRGARFALALQAPDAPSVEDVALGFGYAGGSAVSHLLVDRLSTTTEEVRARLGWKWLANRCLNTQRAGTRAAARIERRRRHAVREHLSQK